MASIKSICVYCGASDSGPKSHREAADRFGRILAQEGIELVFGGGRIGIMGVLANAVLEAGGRAVGVIPEHLRRVELPSHRLSELIIVVSMHARKEVMFRRAEAFVVLPGGLGTLDETFEILTWKQLGLHDRPIVICDLDGYWKPLEILIRNTVRRRYAPKETRRFYQTVDSVEAILPAIAAAPAPKRPDRPEVV